MKDSDIQEFPELDSPTFLRLGRKETLAWPAWRKIQMTRKMEGERKPNMDTLDVKVMVMGLGGAGINAVNNMMQNQNKDVRFAVFGSDPEFLSKSLAEIQILFPKEDMFSEDAPQSLSEKKVEEIRKKIIPHIKDLDMLFLVAGMGGGTGTFIVPVIGAVAKELDVLTLAVVTKPFNFEGKRRLRKASTGIEKLRASVGAIMTIENQKLIGLVRNGITIGDAFRKCDDLLFHCVKAITDLITMPVLNNSICLLDVRAVLDEVGQFVVGTAEASGANRVLGAVTHAISSPLFDDLSIHGARGVLINITGGHSLSLQEVDEVTSVVRDMVHSDAVIFFGTVLDEAMEDDVKVTLVVTGMQ